jgi:hypothetical protein
MICFIPPHSHHDTSKNTKRIDMHRWLRAAVPLLTCSTLCMTLAGCAGTDAVRGRFHYDTRPAERRDAVLLPGPPEIPRYRYVGELTGEPNFEKSDRTDAPLETAFKWIVGLFESKKTVLMQRPQHGAVGEHGQVYVVDAGRNAVLVFDPHPPADEKPAAKADEAEGQLLTWEVLDERTRFLAPVALTPAWNGDIAVSDIGHGAVLRVSPKGELVAKIGAGVLQRPAGLAFDGAGGLLYVADSVANDVKVFDERGQRVNTIGRPGDGDGEFNAPTHVAFTEGHLYVTDTLNNRVQVFDAEGKRVRGFGERGLHVGNLTRPKGVAADSGIAYVVESYYGHLLAFNDKNQLLLAMDGNGMKGDRFFLPSGLWTDGKGKIFIADMFNARVVVLEFLGKKD